MRPHFNADQSAVEYDGGSIPWLAESDMPVDAEFETGRRYDEIMQQAGMQYPDPYVPLAPPVPSSISDRQFFQQLAIDGIITQSEALAAVKVGAIPDAMQQLINELPESERFNAEMLIGGAKTFERSHDLTNYVGAAVGKSPEQIDLFWVAAAAL